jgi:hypothetical protein
MIVWFCSLGVIAVGSCTAHRTEGEEAETWRYLEGRQQFKDLSAGSRLEAWQTSAINKGGLDCCITSNPT